MSPLASWIRIIFQTMRMYKLFLRPRPRCGLIILITTLTIIIILIYAPGGLDALRAKSYLRFYNGLGTMRVKDLDFERLNQLLLTVEDERFRGQILRDHRDLFSFLPWRRAQAGHLDPDPVQKMYLAVVACGYRVNEAMTLLKSAILFSRGGLRLHILAFVNRADLGHLARKILVLKFEADQVGLDFDFTLYESWFPSENQQSWSSMWRPCSTQRLFFPDLLPTIDSVLYIDTDAVIVGNLSRIWGQFEVMDSVQLIGMSPNDELPGDGWYNLHSRVPYYGPRGLNAGVMLMNLTRMRSIGFQSLVLEIHNHYKSQIELADQDILNIFFHSHPELLQELSCTLNFRSSHCACEHDGWRGDKCQCEAVTQDGALIIHGNQASFEKDAYPFIRDIYRIFEKFSLKDGRPSDLLKELKANYDSQPQGCFGLTSNDLYKNFVFIFSKVHK